MEEDTNQDNKIDLAEFRQIFKGIIQDELQLKKAQE